MFDLSHVLSTFSPLSFSDHLLFAFVSPIDLLHTGNMTFFMRNVVERQGKASFTFASIMLLRSASSISSQSSSLSSSCPLAVIYQCHLRLHLPPLRHHHRSRMKHATHREIDWKRDATLDEQGNYIHSPSHV